MRAKRTFRLICSFSPTGFKLLGVLTRPRALRVPPSITCGPPKGRSEPPGIARTPPRLPVRWHRAGSQDQDHVVGRGLPHVGDEPDTEEHDPQADRGEDERGGAGSSHRSTSATIGPRPITSDQARLYTFPQESPANRRNVSMRFRKSRPSIVCSIGRMIVHSIPKRPAASPEKETITASVHSSPVTNEPPFHAGRRLTTQASRTVVNRADRDLTPYRRIRSGLATTFGGRKGPGVMGSSPARLSIST